MNVELGILLSTGKTLWFPARYDGKSDKWITMYVSNSQELPINVSVSYQFFNRDITDNTIIESHLSNNLGDSIQGSCSIDNEILSLLYRDENGDFYSYALYGKITKDLYTSFKSIVSESGYQTTSIENICYHYKDDANILVAELEDSIIFHMMFSPFLESEFDNWYSWLIGGNAKYSKKRLSYEISNPRNILERARDAQIQGWIDMAKEKMKCADGETEVLLWDAVRRLRNSVTYINASFFASVANITMSGMREYGNKAESAFGYGWNAGNAIGTASHFAPGVDGLNQQAQNAIDIIKNAPSCHPPRNPHPYPGDGPQFVQDPSGFVYEGVSSNRVSGVVATAFYKEMEEDMYGDLQENIVKWDAEEYAQENPLFTDENGMYAWDVPQGLWQVKFEKEGYETTYSEWLPVPPPQLDINIAMTQNRQPEVKTARAYEDAVEVEFDKYMMPEFLTTENISVMQAGKPVDGSIVLLNKEARYEGETETFASKVRFIAAQPFTEQEITLLVNNRVKSYAGIRMQDNYQQEFTVEKEIKQILSDSLMVVEYGDIQSFIVSVLPASASAGKTLTVNSSSPLILEVETKEVTIDNTGKAEIIVSGELPGTAALTFSIEGTDKNAVTIVNVVQNAIKTVALPIASIASGSVVEKGTGIALSCSTKGSTIYYTLDGSCPCDDTPARKVYDGSPIIITQSVTIKAMATAPDMYDSEIAEFTYIVKDGEDIEELYLDPKVQIYPLPIKDVLNVKAGGNTIKYVSLTAINGVMSIMEKCDAQQAVLDVSSLPSGVYIINIATDDNVYSSIVVK